MTKTTSTTTSLNDIASVATHMKMVVKTRATAEATAEAAAAPAAAASG